MLTFFFLHLPLVSCSCIILFFKSLVPLNPARFFCVFFHFVFLCFLYILIRYKLEANGMLFFFLFLLRVVSVFECFSVCSCSVLSVDLRVFFLFFFFFFCERGKLLLFVFCITWNHTEVKRKNKDYLQFSCSLNCTQEWVFYFLISRFWQVIFHFKGFLCVWLSVFLCVMC